MKITLNELRSLVKKIIKEELEENPEVEKVNELIPKLQEMGFFIDLVVDMNTVKVDNPTISNSNPWEKNKAANNTMLSITTHSKGDRYPWAMTFKFNKYGDFFGWDNKSGEIDRQKLQSNLGKLVNFLRSELSNYTLDFKEANNNYELNVKF